MILAIDVGNIRTTIALFDREGALSFQSELETDAKMTDDRCAIDLMGVFHLYQAELGRVDGAILSSVVPPITGTYVRTLRRITGRPPLVVGPGLKTGLNIKAEIHNQLGSDIVASAVAVSALYPTPAIVINSRTAVTFSYMSGRPVSKRSPAPAEFHGPGGHPLGAQYGRLHAGRIAVWLQRGL